MKQESEELRALVDYLARALRAENSQAIGANSEKPATSGNPAVLRTEGTIQYLSPQPLDYWLWQNWRIRHVGGGMNGRLFRATGPAGDVAVKFAIRDERDRAGREWAALSMLAGKSATLAPRPLLLERDRYAHQVIVQSWLDGESTDATPADDAAWEALCRHLLEVHSLPMSPVHPAIRPVVLSVTSASDALRAISFQHSCMPRTDWSQAVNDLVDQALSLTWPRWPSPPLCFCRGDPNIRNFIRRPLSWASVDWEYSGWGDPAFEIADFLAHAAHVTWPRRQKSLLVNLYCARSGDTTIRERIPVYETLMLVWWTLRLGRLLPEARSGADTRLAGLSHYWYEEKLELQQQYLQLAAAALADREFVL